MSNEQRDFLYGANLCCSLESSIKLKELGVGQTSFFNWFPVPSDHNELFQNSNSTVIHQVFPWFYRNTIPDLSKYQLDTNIKKHKKYAAFTSLETAHLLPEGIEIDGVWYFYHQSKNTPKGCHIKYINSAGDILAEIISSEQEARALMLITLIEHNHIKIEKEIEVEIKNN